jgi:hypothetical protein
MMYQSALGAIRYSLDLDTGGAPIKQTSFYNASIRMLV